MSPQLSRRAVPLALSVLTIGCAAPAFSATLAHWTGGGGDLNYSNPANWDIGVVPLNDALLTYEVVIPAGFTVFFDVDTPGAVTDFELAATSSFYVDPGHVFTVEDDALIGGVIYVDNASFAALAPGAAFTGNRAQLSALGGGDIAIAATTYSATGLNAWGTVYQLFNASGAGTLVNLAGLITLNSGFNDNSSGVTVHRIRAANGAIINLSGLQSVIGPPRAEDRLEFIIDTDGLLDLAGLQSVDGGYVRFAVNVPAFTMPAFLSAANTTFDLATGTTLSFPVLASFGGTLNIPAAATVQAPVLTDMTGTTVNLSDTAVCTAPTLVAFRNSSVNLTAARTFDTGLLADIDNSRFVLSNGAQFGTAYGDFAATAYSSTGLAGWGTVYTLFSATGAGTVLDLSSVNSLNAAFQDNSSATTIQRVAADSGGTVDLSGLQTLAGALRSEDRLEFVAAPGGILDLSALQSVTGYTRFALQTPTYALPALLSVTNTTFDVAAGATLSLPALLWHDGGGLTLATGATLNASSLMEINGVNVSLGDGALLAAPNVISFTRSSVALTPTRTLGLGALENLDGSRFTLSGGATFGAAYGDISATTYSSTALNSWGTVYDLFNASGPGTLFDGSTLVSLNAAFNDNSTAVTLQRITASEDALVDLSAVHSIQTPPRAEDRLEFTAESGGLLDLGSLQAITGAGVAKFTIGGAAQMFFGDLTVTSNVQFALTDVTSTLDVAGSLLLDAGSFSVTAGAQVDLGGHFTFRYTNEANMSAQSGIVQFGGVAPQWLEVGGADVGFPTDENVPNFGLGQLVVGRDDLTTVVQLMDAIDNGNRGLNVPEALYLYGLGGPDGLEILGGSTLRLNALKCYAKIAGEWVLLNSLFPDGVVEIPFGDGYILRDAGTQIVGDLNCDGAVNALDINPFVVALVNPAGYAAQYPDCYIGLADINADRAVNALDINPFVRLLTH